MSIFAIGDLHLSGGADKPMSVFGPQWEGHWDRIQTDWRARVKDADTVLIPGDISWAMKPEDAETDLKQIGALPGRKILLRGNHDYWWGSISRVRDLLPDTMYALQNDAVILDGITYCGSRGWTVPVSDEGDDTRIYAREVIRLRLSLEKARQLSPKGILIALVHFPPLGENGVSTAVSDLMEEYHVGDVVYGHLHGISVKAAFTGNKNGVRYHFVSCDGIGFKLYQLS